MDKEQLNEENFAAQFAALQATQQAENPQKQGQSGENSGGTYSGYAENVVYNQNAINETADLAKKMLSMPEKERQEFELQMSGEEPTFKPTNIAYFDDRLKNNTATLYDAYIAKKFMGLNLAEYGDTTKNVNLKGKLKTMSATGSMDRMSDNYAFNRIFENEFIQSEGNLGLWNGLSRKMHESFTNWHPEGDNDKSQIDFMRSNDQLTTADAKLRSGKGTATNQMREDSKKSYGTGTKDYETYLKERTAMAKNNLAQYESDIRNNLNKGHIPNKEVWQDFLQAKERAEYLESVDGSKFQKDSDYRWKVYDDFKKRFKGSLGDSFLSPTPRTANKQDAVGRYYLENGKKIYPTKLPTERD